MKNYRVFNVYFMPSTDRLPARLRIRDLRNKRGVSLPVKYDNTYDMSAYERATLHLKSIGIDIIGHGQAQRGFVLFTENFETQIS